MTQQLRQDHWSADAYAASASFVPELTTTILSWLDLQPQDVVMDLGCGDGKLTAKIKNRCASTTGFDASLNLIEAAQRSYGSSPDMAWMVQDCRFLEHSPHLEAERYSKVFSNAALHWILRDPGTRISVLKAAFKALQPGGVFVFEMGGAGNVAEVHTALLAALVHQGLSIQQARIACPWFFPCEKLMITMLEAVGFKVEKSQLEYRPTELTTEKEGGLEGWVRLMGAQFFEALPVWKREAAVGDVCETLETVVTHEEDNSAWLGYVRLRVKAKKP
ncbi:hypothetical protein MMC24_003245 [Lignoscripta atroalba]|nr:hypothetical protein [Lignoscripta atroalba]